MGALREKHLFDFDAGRPSLDFVNTLSGLRGVRPVERVTEYADLAFWARQLGVIDRRKMAELLEQAALHPRRAGQALVEALAAREALHDVVVAAIEGREPLPLALEVVNAWIARALQHRRLRPAGAGRYQAVFEDDGDLIAFLRPIALDAADLLEHGLQGGRVRRCQQAAEGRCGWLFLDETRNHSRRWCSMKECGNQAKQRRHWRRHREG